MTDTAKGLIACVLMLIVALCFVSMAKDADKIQTQRCGSVRC